MALAVYTPPKKPRSTAKDAQGFTVDQVYFQGWLATPKALREYPDQRALAKHLEVSEWALGRWKHLPGFGEAVIKYKQEAVRSDHVAAVIDAQVIRAIASGDTKAAKLVLQAVGLFEGHTDGHGGTAIQINIDTAGPSRQDPFEE